MTMKPCRECRARISTRAMVCPRCGYQCRRSFSSRIFYLIVAIVLLSIGGSLAVPVAVILAGSLKNSASIHSLIFR